MSTEQWAAMMRGDESYAGSESFFRMKRVVHDLTGFRHMIPDAPGPRGRAHSVHRDVPAAEHVVPNNTHFDTTRANIEFTGARARGPADSGSRRHAGAGWISRAIWMWRRWRS